MILAGIHSFFSNYGPAPNSLRVHKLAPGLKSLRTPAVVEGHERIYQFQADLAMKRSKISCVCMYECEKQV